MMIETFLHRWLRVPYTLHVRYIRAPKGAKQTVLFIHGIGSSGNHWKGVLKDMPKDVRVITVDLLGFGNSPAPDWAIYNTKTQARSIIATLLKLRVTSPLIIVGHSLGSLVSIELARKYPLRVRRLILCSPPLYTDDSTRTLNGDAVLKKLYRTVQEYPSQFVYLTKLGFKYKLLRGDHNISAETIGTYVATLDSAIVNQTSLSDAQKLKVSTLIIRGRLDPLVVPRNLSSLAKSNPNISLQAIAAGHDIRGRFVPAVVAAVKDSLEPNES